MLSRDWLVSFPFRILTPFLEKKFMCMIDKKPMVLNYKNFWVAIMCNFSSHKSTTNVNDKLSLHNNIENTEVLMPWSVVVNNNTYKDLLLTDTYKYSREISIATNFGRLKRKFLVKYNLEQMVASIQWSFRGSLVLLPGL